MQASNDVSRFIRLGKRTYFYHMLERLTPKQPNVRASSHLLMGRLDGDQT